MIKILFYFLSIVMLTIICYLYNIGLFSNFDSNEGLHTIVAILHISVVFLLGLLINKTINNDSN